MWSLVVTLLMMQQATGTPVDARMAVIDGFDSERTCDRAAKKLTKSYEHKATEPTSDWDGDGAQPKADQFPLMVPLIDCIEKR